MVQTRSSSKRIASESNTTKNANSSEQVASTVRSVVATVAREESRPPRKRQRPQVDERKSKNTRRDEKEKTSPKLNLDILFLIAEYLHPIDLLTLARTCKSIRDLLMDRSSTFVWRAARRRMNGLPDCPPDLSEPEYANLVFYARCHNCGKPAQTILWAVRRRYCPSCRPQRMRPLSSSWMMIRKRDILPAQWCDVKNVFSYRVDKEQLKAFRDKYETSSDKTQLLNEMRELCRVILEHAAKCEAWQEKRNRERSKDMGVLRDNRTREIYQCLQKHGYIAELKYDWQKIRSEYISIFNFRSSKPLTDKEWAHLPPQWIEVMDRIRANRLERTVYNNRRQVLQRAYDKYLAEPSTLTEPNDIFPHMEDTATFPPFDRVIRAPEESVVDMESFEAAFAELPTFVQGWRKKVDAAIASLIEIPPALSSVKSATKSSRSTKQKKLEPGLSRVAKLHLASAVFLDTAYNQLLAYPELLSFGAFRQFGAQDLGNKLPYRIEFCDTASYVIHASGLDPHVATVEDMEYRNPRLICLDCDGPRIVRTWQNAICHAHGKSHRETPPHWQLVSDEYLDAIEAVEQTEDKPGSRQCYQCLLCKPRAGDSQRYDDLCSHLFRVHGVEFKNTAIKRGVHYRTLHCGSSSEGMVQMVEEGDQVKFSAVTVNHQRRW